MLDKEYEAIQAKRMAESHARAQILAKHKGKAIIAPGTQLRVTISLGLIGGLIAMSIAYPFLQETQGSWLALLYPIIGLVGAGISLLIFGGQFVVDESLD